MKILLISSDGLIGSYLNLSLRANHKLYVTSRNEIGKNIVYFDLEKSHVEVLQLIKLKNIEYIIWLIGKTNIDYCEKNPKSFLINCELTINFFDKLKHLSIPIIYFSTNAVFDCKLKPPSEYDVTCPACNYGIQKDYVEKYLINNYFNYSIIRVSKVISKKNNFFVNLTNAITKKTPLNIYSDLYFSPISLSYIHNFLLMHINNFNVGIYHLSSNDSITYENFTKLYFLKKGLKLSNFDNIKFVSSSDVKFKPEYASLLMNFTKKTYKINYESIDESIDSIL